MSKIIAASSTGLVFLSAIIAGTLYSGNSLETLNAQVENKAQQMFTDNGNTLSDKQKHDLKMDMLVDKVTTADEKALKYQEKAAMVIATYQLSDPRDQHKLLAAMATEENKI
ncbi:MAG: hypothetical protein MJK04_23705 [Psychrosphaera sp.]|nr:hypothetical protein [Psychrosphaera sp.]